MTDWRNITVALVLALVVAFGGPVLRAINRLRGE